MKRESYFIPLLIILLFLTGCASDKLVVQTHYVGRNSLASYHVNTPDPLLNNPPIGQQLLISWYLPRSYLNYENLHLEVHTRCYNREEYYVCYPIRRASGTYIYSLINKDYFTTGGIVTYKILLIGGGCVLDEWIHPLWKELIIFEPSDDEQEALEYYEE